MHIKTRSNKPQLPSKIVLAIRYDYFIKLLSYANLAKKYSITSALARKAVQEYKHVIDTIPQKTKTNRTPIYKKKANEETK